MKRIILALAVTVIIGFGLFMLFSNESSVDDNHTVAKKEEPLNRGLEKENEKQSTKVDSGSKSSMAIDQVDREKPSFLNKYEKLFNQQISEIQFYGKVVDQNKDPVDRLNVKYKIEGGTFGEGWGQGIVETDSNGIFKVGDAKGLSLRITGMDKDGYQVVLKGQTIKFYPDKLSNEHKPWNECTLDNPCQFYAWKYPSEKVRKEKLIRKSVVASIKTDGTKYSLDLFAYGSNKISTDLSAGQYTMSIVKGDDGSDHWMMSIEGSKSKLIEAKGMYTNLPPENGYTDSVVITNDGVGSEKNIVTKTFYMFLSEKKIYGRFSIELRVNLKRNKAAIVGFYSLNPSGDRILDTFDDTTGYNG